MLIRVFWLNMLIFFGVTRFESLSYSRSCLKWLSVGRRRGSVFVCDQEISISGLKCRRRSQKSMFPR